MKNERGGGGGTGWARRVSKRAGQTGTAESSDSYSEDGITVLNLPSVLFSEPRCGFTGWQGPVIPLKTQFFMHTY